MGLTDSDRKNVDLVAGLLTMEQPTDMNLFNIIGRSLVESNSKKMLRMTIVMKRKIMSEMMTTYFPSLLLMMITFATTFFKPFFFEAALSVNLTTMLVMTTIFISKMEGLPPTSDIKMIDIWLIFCQLVPFSEVVLLTAIEYLREDQMENGTNNINSKRQQILEYPERQHYETYLLVLKTIGKYFEFKKFPKKLISFSLCFRKERGACDCGLVLSCLLRCCCFLLL